MISQPRIDRETAERHRSMARLVAWCMLVAGVFLSLAYAALTVVAAH